jgi:hypothetical protein
MERVSGKGYGPLRGMFGEGLNRVLRPAWPENRGFDVLVIPLKPQTL